MTVAGFFPLPHFKHSQFKFLSVFKWEERKGWRVLLEAFAREFSFEDNVALYILTQPFTEATTEEKVQQLILNFTESLNVSHPLPPIWVLPFHVAYQDVPRIYASVDAFVLPTHGEGWGRPIVEAMAMQLPVIATNWSGPTAYLDETNGFPLPIDGLEDASVFHKSHRWAKPSLFALRRLMRYVSNRDNALEVKRLARKARSDMLLKFSRTHLGNIIAFRLDDIVSRVGYPKAQASLGNGVPLDWDGIDSDLPLETEPLSAGDESRFTLLSREVIEQPLGLRQNV
jgi:glycosyltransferase involved in cell wall biosynthesis